MSVHIDCDTCVVRGLACHDCVVTVLLGPPPELGFDEDEQRALDVLAGSGLVPPLADDRPGVWTGRRVGLTHGTHVTSVTDVATTADRGRGTRPRKRPKSLRPPPARPLALLADACTSRPNGSARASRSIWTQVTGVTVVRSRGTKFLGLNVRGTATDRGL